MATIFKSDIDAMAATYLKNMVNSGINPYHSGWMPAYVDGNKLAAFTTDPASSHPANWLSGDIKGQSMRDAMVMLGTYYAYIAYSHYGLWYSNNAPAYWINQGWGYFMINPNISDIQGHATGVVNAISTPGLTTGNITMARVQQLYTLAWNAINSRKADVTIELGVCHNSCHNNCHDSRGRR